MALAAGVQKRTDLSRIGTTFEALRGDSRRTGRTSRDAGFEFQVARTLADIDALGPAWKALEGTAVTPVFFQSYHWCRHVVMTLQKQSGSASAIEPFVVTAWQNGRLVAVWPLQLMRESATRILTDLSCPFGQYADVIIGGDARVAADAIPAAGLEATWPGPTRDLCALLIDEARRLSGADALVLRKVRADTPLSGVLSQTALALQPHQQAPYVSMAGFATFTEFMASTKAKTRKNVRNATHRLEKLGTVTHLVERRSARMDEALKHCFDMRSSWLEEKGVLSTAFAHPAFADLVRGLADPASHEVDVLSMMLMLDDQPISIHYGFLHNRRYYAFMAARNPAFDACSPGKVHLEHVMAACFENGADTVDLLAPEMPYKLVWTSQTVETEDYGITWSMRGWVSIDLWRRRLRPAVLSAFMALPCAMRQRIAALMRAKSD